MPYARIKGQILAAIVERQSRFLEGVAIVDRTIRLSSAYIVSHF